MSSVKWSRKSTRTVAVALAVSPAKAGRMMRAADFRLRVNRKRLTRRSSPDRDEQFENIDALREDFQRRGQPVISVDAKKRELVGWFKNPGRIWCREPIEVNTYDFRSDAEGVAIPYGIYDVVRRDGFVVVGTSHNTPAFAGNSVGQWWSHAGRQAYPDASELLVLADAGSSNGFQAQGWKLALQKLAEFAGLLITVAHYPTGASKWNPVEHRLFSAISNTWSGVPLVSYEVITGCIRSTRAPSGAPCRVRLDRRYWPTQKESQALARTRPHRRPHPSVLRVRSSKTLPHWNYTIVPSSQSATDQVV
jgi:DDE family transposase